MTEKFELYAFSGRAGVGKNYVAEHLFAPILEPKPTLIVAFADHFKVEICARLSHQSDIFTKVFLGKKDDATRTLLQQHGTECRRLYGPDYWINILAAWIDIHRCRGIKRVIITDVRYKNEAEWIKKMGGVLIRVEAPQRQKEQESNHESERDLDQYQFDHIIYNDYKDCSTLDSQVESLVEQLRN